MQVLREVSSLCHPLLDIILIELEHKLLVGRQATNLVHVSTLLLAVVIDLLLVPQLARQDPRVTAVLAVVEEEEEVVLLHFFKEGVHLASSKSKNSNSSHCLFLVCSHCDAPVDGEAAVVAHESLGIVVADLPGEEVGTLDAWVEEGIAVEYIYAHLMVDPVPAGHLELPGRLYEVLGLEMGVLAWLHCNDPMEGQRIELLIWWLKPERHLQWEELGLLVTQGIAALDEEGILENKTYE